VIACDGLDVAQGSTNALFALFRAHYRLACFLCCCHASAYRPIATFFVYSIGLGGCIAVGQDICGLAGGREWSTLVRQLEEIACLWS